MRHWIVLFFLFSNHAFAEQDLSVGTGFDFSSGKYGGTSAVDYLYVPVVIKYETGRLSLKLNVPYISMTSTGTTSGVIRGVGRTSRTTTTTTSQTTTVSGLGDIVTTAGYTAYEGDSMLLDMVGKIKFGTADANKELGTGKNDYSAQLDAYFLQNRLSEFTTIGYKTVGVPDGLALRNVYFSTIGMGYKLKAGTSLGIMYDWAQASNIANENSQELTIYSSFKIGDATKLQLNAMKGFSTSSPEYSVGVMLTAYF